MKVASTIPGVNCCVNPYSRLMFNYTRGDNDYTGDSTNQYAIRTQWNY